MVNGSVNDADYQSRKIAFVSDNEGSSIARINGICLTAAVSLRLSAGLIGYYTETLCTSRHTYYGSFVPVGSEVTLSIFADFLSNSCYWLSRYYWF